VISRIILSVRESEGTRTPAPGALTLARQRPARRCSESTLTAAGYNV